MPAATAAGPRAKVLWRGWRCTKPPCMRTVSSAWADAGLMPVRRPISESVKRSVGCAARRSMTRIARSAASAGRAMRASSGVVWLAVGGGR